MQRRTPGPSQLAPSGAKIGSTRTPSVDRKHKKKGRGLAPILAMICMGVSMMTLSTWYFFPTAVVQVEQEAERDLKGFAKKAIEAEHLVDDWFQQNQGMAAVAYEDSTAATARMMAQDSNWVDGERKLKKKLKQLLEQQQEGKLLGAPVLTRWLGDDFPAWVGEGMKEEEWKANVDARYAEMRKEEEEWQLRMKALIDQRERDMGITTA
jgi:hypothetical protein